MTLIVVQPNGTLRAIHDDNFDFRVFGLDAFPSRASQVEPVQVGPHRGDWYVDFSPLGSGYELCLLSTFRRRGLALAAEVDWLKRNWLHAAQS